MNACNQDITIWNKWRNPETKQDQLFRFIIPVKCRWEQHIARGVSGTSAVIASSFSAVIPANPFFKEQGEWDNLTDEERVQYFTLRPGDVLALGAIEEALTESVADLKNKYAPNCMTVKAYQDNTIDRYGAHFRVEGV